MLRDPMSNPKIRACVHDLRACVRENADICALCVNGLHPLTMYGHFTCSKPYCQFEIFDPSIDLPY